LTPTCRPQTSTLIRAVPELAHAYDRLVSATGFGPNTAIHDIGLNVAHLQRRLKSLRAES
jgi:hypothetical protein